MKKLNKKVLFAAWGCHNKKWHTYQLWDKPLRRIFSHVATFDPQEEFYKLGKKEMNRKFLEIVEKERPDYIYFWFMWEEFYPETLFHLRRKYPNIKTICYNGDDDYKFENYTINFVPFIDAFLITQPDYVKLANNMGIKTFAGCGADIEEFKPNGAKKKYDVSFVGTPKADRIDNMRHLIKNGINAVVCGAGWERYPEFKNQHLGEINHEQFIELINESKINICLSKNYFGGTHILERFFEINACKSFCLTEYTKGYFPLFKEGEDIVTFKNQDELLEKVSYFLKNEKEREKIAEKAYNKTIERFFNQDLLLKAIKYLEKKASSKDDRALPKFAYLTLNDLEKGENYLKSLLNDCEYIFFKNKGYFNLPYKEYFQINSINIMGKEMCTCNCMLSSRMIGDYASLDLLYTLDYLPKEYFYDNLDIAQICVKKNYFLKNIDKFISMYKGEKPTFITKENTIMNSFSLVRTYKKKKIPYNEKTEHILFTSFDEPLLILKNKGNVTRHPYPYKLLIYSLLSNRQILKIIMKDVIPKSKNKRLIGISKLLERVLPSNS